MAVLTGYEVHGIIRRSSSFNTGRIEHLYRDVHERRFLQALTIKPLGSIEILTHWIFAGPNMLLHYGDLTDTTNLVYVISQVRPTEIYNLAAQSHVKVSFDMAEYTVCWETATSLFHLSDQFLPQGDVDGLGTLRLLDAIRTCGLTNHIRFYQVGIGHPSGMVQRVLTFR